MIETKDLKEFSIDKWYALFADISIETQLFELDEDLLKRLQDDGCDTDIQSICSSEYVNQLKNAISHFNNKAFVKNNWHAPVDAKFMSFGNTLQVTNVDELILYLNASDIIINDFKHKDIQFYIAVRPWLSIHPASEFRCIVINKILRGITPRDWLTYYPHFHQDGPKVIEAITNFFTEKIKNKYTLQNYTFDVIMPTENEMLLVDFGPLNAKTELYAFKWSEIKPIIQKNSTNDVVPVFRYLESDLGILTPSLYKTLKIE